MEEKQLKYQKLQFYFSLLNTLFIGVLVVVVLFAVVNVLPKVNDIYNSTMVSLNNLEEVSTTLKEADLQGMIKNVDKLSTSAADDLAVAMKKIEEIDVDKLNQSIDNLNAVIRPLADFFR